MHTQRARVWTVVAMVALTLLYVYGLYQQALFFTPLQTYIMTTVVLFGLVVGIALGGWRLKMPIWLLFGFAYGVYTLLTTLWAANAEYAIEGGVMIVGAVLIAVLGTVLPLRSKRYLLDMLAVAGPVVYLFGLGAVLGFWAYTSASMPDQNGNIEMNSVFQYHNTFGAFELLSFTLSVGLSDLAKTWWQRAIYTLMAGLSILGVLSSYSREVWILLPVSVILLVLAQWMRKRAGRTILTAVYAIISAVAAAAFAIPALSHSSKHMALLAVLTVVVASFVLTLFDSAFQSRVRQKNLRVGILSGLGVIVLAAMVFIVHHESHKLGSIVSRVTSIQLKDFSVQQRLLFYQAALHMWQHNPVVGAGYGTWTAKFLAYQQYPYEATLVHSVVMDNLLNGGLIGFLLWIACIVLAIISGIKAIRRLDAQSALSAVGLVAAVIMLLHGALDFDFSFALITVTFFLLLGISVQPQPQLAEESQPSKVKSWSSPVVQRDSAPKWVRVGSPIMNILMGAAACVAVIFGGMLSAAEHLYKKATTTDASVITSEEADLNKAIQWAPYYADPHTQLANVEMAQLSQAKTGQQQYEQTAWQQAQIAAKQDPWNPKTLQSMATIAYHLGQSTQAIAWAKRAALDSPFHAEYPTTFMGISLWTALVQYPQVGKTASDPRFTEIVQQYQFAKASVVKQQKMTFGYSPSWTYQVTAPMQTYAGAADYALGNYQTSLADVANLSTVSSDATTTGLRDIVVLLDNQRLHPGYKDAKVEKEINADSTLKQEYQILSQIHPLK